jgi:hypothetical protein
MPDTPPDAPTEEPTGSYYQRQSFLLALEARLQAIIPVQVVLYLRYFANPVVALFHCLAALSLYIALFELFYHYFMMSPYFIAGISSLTATAINIVGIQVSNAIYGLL